VFGIDTTFGIAIAWHFVRSYIRAVNNVRSRSASAPQLIDDVAVLDDEISAQACNTVDTEMSITRITRAGARCISDRWCIEQQRDIRRSTNCISGTHLRELSNGVRIREGPHCLAAGCAGPARVAR
jgi:hypothetical protein